MTNRQTEINYILENAYIDEFTDDAQQLIRDVITDMYLNPDFSKKSGIADEVIRARLHRLNRNIIQWLLVKFDFIQKETNIKNQFYYFQKLSLLGLFDRYMLNIYGRYFCSFALSACEYEQGIPATNSILPQQ